MLNLGYQGEEMATPNSENAYNGSYPLARYLYVYVNKAPRKELPQVTQELIKLIFSRQGQTIVQKDGYFPVSPEIARQELAKFTRTRS